MLSQATQHLIAAVRNPAASDADMQAAAQSLFNATGRASRTDANAALATLAAHLSTEDLSRAGFLALACGAVLDNESIVAIEPATMLGVLGRISGVVDNFQLNVLLMDGFPKSGFFARRRVPQRVADVARGVGPQQTNEMVTSVWNLYTWQAI